MFDYQEIIILEELIHDDLHLEIINAAVDNLIMQPVNIVEHPRIEPVRNEYYYENVVPHYTLDDFHNHFRMSRATFQNLKIQLQRANVERINERVPFEKKLLFTIWMLSKPESFIAAGDRFNIAKSTCHQIFFDVISCIASLRSDLIIWPNENQRQHTARVLQNKSGIPGIIGAIDGCHIAIKAPPHNSVDYYNRNNYHSVVLQAVCNDRKEFIDIFVGMPGRVHDARVFRQSDLYTLLTRDNRAVHENEHLLGDAAYPLSQYLLKPYRDNGHLSEGEIRFNTRMSSVRSMVEQAFGLLKCKFRRLKYLDMARIDFVPTVITAACVLHNFIIMNESIERYEDNVCIIPRQNENDNLINNVEGNGNHVAEGKRNYIASLLH